MKITLYGRNHRNLESDGVVSFTTEPAADLGDCREHDGKGAFAVDVVYTNGRTASFTQVFKMRVE